jgi:hypothetical protein
MRSIPYPASTCLSSQPRNELRIKRCIWSKIDYWSTAKSYTTSSGPIQLLLHFKLIFLTQFLTPLFQGRTYSACFLRVSHRPAIKSLKVNNSPRMKERPDFADARVMGQHFQKNRKSFELSRKTDKYSGNIQPSSISPLLSSPSEIELAWSARLETIVPAITPGVQTLTTQERILCLSGHSVSIDI